jgi:hypothetical protein
MQGVGIEEGPPVVSDRRCHHVVEHPLDHVGVGTVAGGQQQPPGQHDRRDAGTGLRVRPVRRQHEILAERLVGMP